MVIIGVCCAGSIEKRLVLASRFDSEMSLCRAQRASKWQGRELTDCRLSIVSKYLAGEWKSHLESWLSLIGLKDNTSTVTKSPDTFVVVNRTRYLPLFN
jgi:hypothetical protein